MYHYDWFSHLFLCLILLFFRLVPVGSPLFPPGQAVSTYMLGKIYERQEATAYSGKLLSRDIKDFYWEEFKVNIFSVFLCE